MTPKTTEMPARSRARTIGWIAGAIGGFAGVAALAYSRRPRSRWERARNRAGDLMGTAREQAKPWMGYTASGVAAGTALVAYLRRRRQSPVERVANRARELAAEARI